MNVAMTIKLLLLTLIWMLSVIKYQETGLISLGSDWRRFSEFLVLPLTQTDLVQISLYFGIILIITKFLWLKPTRDYVDKLNLKYS